MRKFTNEQFINLCKSKFIILDNYENTRTKIKCQCVDCQNIFYGNPKLLLKQKGCNFCGIQKAKNTIKYNLNTEDFKKKLSKTNPDKIVLGEYINCKTKILIKCKVCLYEWSVIPYKITRSGFNGCERCGHQRRIQKSFLLTQEEYTNKIKNIFYDKITILGQYKGGSEKISFRCNKCNKIYSKKAKLLSEGKGCLICQRSKSKYEDIIEQKLNKLGIKFISQYNFKNLKSEKGKPYLFDFCILNEKNDPIFIIEFHGDQHYKPIEYFGGNRRFIRQQESDAKKEKYLIENNINYVILNKNSLPNYNWNILYEKCKTNTDL